MAETRRLSSAPSNARRASARPRLPHPPYRPSPAPRLRLDETHNLRPPEWQDGIEQNHPESDCEPAPPPAAVRLPRFIAAPPPRRTRAERAVLGVLVLGLALNAFVLLRYATLTRADILLGATVLLAGLALLVLMEVYRRTER